LISIRTSFSYFFLPHLDLHSFPTRRSSDLKLPFYLHIFIGIIGRLEGGFIEGINRLAVRVGNHPRPRPAIISNMFKEFGNKGFRDRKSTRLNSSHVSISYAVFCLKKKIKQQ